MFYILSAIIIVILVFIDQIIKFWAVHELQPQGSIEFLTIGKKEILRLTYLENDGAMFGSLSGMRLLLIISTAILMVICVYALYKFKNRSKFVSAALILVLSGGIGNLIDRIFRGGRVVDYFEIKLFRFAIFNFADCCVTVGIAMLLIWILFSDSLKNKKKKKAEQNADTDV